MIPYSSLFLKKFNPCADQVESIDKSLRGELDEKSSVELMGHLEKCKRCRRYHGYMEAVEKGFRESEITASEIGAISTQELPSSLQTEMAQAMKRNLSRWMFEIVRSIMHSQGMLVRFFLDLTDLNPYKESVSYAQKIFSSLQNMNGLSKDEAALLPQAGYLINTVTQTHGHIEKEVISDVLESCLSLHKDNFLPYFYYDQIYFLTEDYESAKKLYQRALSQNPSSIWKGYFLNNMGGFSHIKGLLDDAIKLFNDALKIYEFPNLHLNLAMALLDNKLIDLTIRHIHNAFVTTEDISSIIMRKKQQRLCYSYLMYHYNRYRKTIDSSKELSTLFENIQE